MAIMSGKKCSEAITRAGGRRRRGEKAATTYKNKGKKNYEVRGRREETGKRKK